MTTRINWKTQVTGAQGDLGLDAPVSMKPNEAWNADDAQRLQQRRVEAGWTMADLARRACLSIAQVMQLEQGGDSHFYTPTIKLLAGRRALASLQRWVPARRSQVSADDPYPPEVEASQKTKTDTHRPAVAPPPSSLNS